MGYSYSDDVSVFLVCSGVAVFYLIIVPVLFYYPLRSHRSWVEKNGMFSRVITSEKVSESKSGVLKIENPLPKLFSEGKKSLEFHSNVDNTHNTVIENKTYSIADEILKLKNMMDQGLLTEEEFSAAKNKLLRDD